MTPEGFKAWVRDAEVGDQIIYHQGLNLAREKPLRDAAWAAYEEGTVTLAQARIHPMQGINRKTIGTFAYIARRRAT
jgi:hypothetical protein